MKISVDQLRTMIRDSKLSAAMVEDNEISLEKLQSFKNLSSEEIEGLKINAEYWMKNYSTFEMSYAPQYEYEPTPIYIYGIRGLYLVKELDQDGKFFNSKKDAFAYANEAIKIFYIDFE
jgi:hypothetical protein